MLLGKRLPMAAMVAAVVLGGVATPAAALVPRLSEHDERLVAEATERGQRTVQAMIMTDARGVAALPPGARVRYRADEVGYLRVEVPTDRVAELRAAPGVRALEVSEEVRVPQPEPDGGVGTQGVGTPIPQQPPTASTPRVNPYLPTGDIGAAQFVDANPTWDGRGTTIAVVDLGMDVDHPALTATTTGERKIVDWVSSTDGGFTDGVNNDNDPTWVSMTGRLPADYVAPPGVGGAAFGVLNERDPGFEGDVNFDVNRDGNPAGSAGTFGVLWDKPSNTVWVDANQNKSFADEPAMTNYRVRGDIGYFGTDNPATPVRETMPFVINTDPANQSVNVGIVSGSHGTLMGGLVAGNKLLGGSITGVAPGAKLVSVRACLVHGCSLHSWMEAVIFAARDAKVDVISMSLGALMTLNDGRTPRALLFQRIVETYGVPIFVAAGNEGSGANSVDDPGVGDGVFGVGAYISKSTWLSTNGFVLPAEDNLHPFSSRGPREDGGQKPNFVAPGTGLTTMPRWLASPAGPGFAYPNGYGSFSGTSIATPLSAGSAAVLLSAAKATGVGWSPAALRQAIASSSRYLPAYQAYEQGAGLLQVDKAWELLKTKPAVTDISVSVPVHTLLAGHLTTPGVGIHDREGVHAGDQYVREYTVTRNSGLPTPVTYAVSWQGNDGTFRSAGSITLPKGQAVRFPVNVNVASPGIHSATVRFDDPNTVGVEFQTLNTVIAAEDFTVKNGFELRFAGQLGRNQAAHHFIRVAQGTGSLKIDMVGGGTTPGAGQIRFVRYHPYGIAGETSYPGSAFCYNPPSPGGSCTGGTPTSRIITNPIPGVWEIAVETRRTSDADVTPYSITAAVFGARVSPERTTIDSLKLGQPIAGQFTFRNEISPFTGRATGTTLGSARISRPSVDTDQRVSFPVRVAPGATGLRAKIANPSDIGADLDLTLYDCTTGTCRVAASGAKEASPEEEVSIDNPAAGEWKVEVFGKQLPNGSTAFDYLDVITDPAYGSVDVRDTPTSRPVGANWSVQTLITANRAPEPGRVLLGGIEVRTTDNLTIGSAEILIRTVQP